MVHMVTRTEEEMKRTDAVAGRAVTFIMLVFVAVLTTTQAGLGQNAATNAQAPALHISAGDLLAVDVFDTPELSAKLRVDEKGRIAVPLAGDVTVGGLTAEQAARAIEQRLSDAKILKSPQVSVFIQEYATQGVSVLGEVKNPGVYPVLGAHGLLDFISLAGGVTPTAAKTVTITHKGDMDHPETVQLNSAPGMVLRAGITILPGDTIVVARSGIVYVLGDLAKPGGFLIENNDRLTVIQAVALAQGTNHTASLNGAKLIRKTSAGRQELPVELKNILAGKRDDIRLEDGDILFVPASKGKAIAYRGIEATVGMATGLVAYNRF